MENQNVNQPGAALPALPNAVLVLIFGICSIAFCWTAGVVGLVLGIIALILAGKAKKVWDANPGMYSQGSFNSLKAGRICSIIGVILSALYLVYVIIVVLIVGAAFTSMPWNSF